MSEFFVCLQFRFVREFAALAQFTLLLARSAVVWTLIVVVALVQRIIVARCW